jgi:integrase/recombinase XerD
MEQQVFVAKRAAGRIEIREKKLESPREAPRYALTPEEIRELIYAVSNNPRDRCIIKLLAYTGMRREELQALDVQDVDFDRSLIIIRKGKFGKARTVPVAKDVLGDLKFLIGERLKGPLFASQKSERISLRQINEIVAKAGRLANIKNPNPKRRHINPHLLRHSFSRNFLKAGGRLEVLMQLLGHASIRTTIDTYGIPSQEDILIEYEKLRKLYS